MGTDDRPIEAKVADATFQLVDRRLGVLQWEMGQSAISIGMFADDIGDVVVGLDGHSQCVGRRCGVPDQARAERQHVHVHPDVVHRPNAFGRSFERSRPGERKWRLSTHRTRDLPTLVSTEFNAVVQTTRSGIVRESCGNDVAVYVDYLTLHV